jgi:hypothetical protein
MNQVVAANILEIVRQIRIYLILARRFGFKNIKDTVAVENNKFNKAKILLDIATFVFIEVYKFVNPSKSNEPNVQIPRLNLISKQKPATTPKHKKIICFA